MKDSTSTSQPGSSAVCGCRNKSQSLLALAAPSIGARAADKKLVIGGSVPLTGAAAETGLNVNNGYITADGTIVKQTGQLDKAKLTSIIESELL